jgi:ATP-binding cassette subfamily F protein 3
MINLSNGTKLQGTRVLFQDSSFQINPGEKVGLVGANGSGKTTLFRVLVGEEPLDGGEISTGKLSVIGYFSQDVGEMKGRSALEEVTAGAGKVADLAQQIAQMEKQLNDSGINPLGEEEMAQLLERYGDAQTEFQNLGGYDLDSRAKEILTGLGIGPGDFEMPVESFSGGWKMRIALAKILVLNPDVLLMDEPTNHLDIESILWLEAWIKSYKGALLMTSHDRDFMNGIVSRIFEIGNSALTVYSGNYDFYITEREIRREQLLASHKRQQDMLAKEEEFIARFGARASHAAQVQSRVKKLEKIERIEIPPETKTIHFDFATPPRSGNDVVEFVDLAKTWVREDGVEKPVFHGINGMVQRLDKIAVTGVNGAGKSTLLKIICGDTEPTEGTARIGANVSIGYFSQHSADILNPENTVINEMTAQLPQANLGLIRNLLGAFLFSGDDVDKKISVLSGGEKSRLVLALILARPINLLILDEPTNHLDIESRAVLLRAIQNFEGTVMVVSHDRYFLRAIVNRVFEIDHGELRDYKGTYDYYLSKHAERLAAE